ncbi:hypothetical protein SAMN05660443_0221 [Marinospirillum celere]|uniref:Uncharacterized protein n=1 Tax=Marinospirillum celere TaxID=1122252 RepID=A0A1I1E5R5_9GAMM|nr:hypothetical protein SAMN05660443_0221 [Marinospirillum celere]
MLHENSALQRIPEEYKQAELRTVTPADKGNIGIAFNTEDKVTRLKISLKDSETLAYLMRSQSFGSAGKPKAEVSSSSPVDS